MTQEERDRAEVIEAHQELVAHIEKSSARIRALSAVTIVVAIVLSVSYSYELLLPALGTSSVTVDLDDPANQAAELLVLTLALLWLYVGLRDYSFSSRLRREIRRARSKESEIEKRITS